MILLFNKKYIILQEMFTRIDLKHTQNTFWQMFIESENYSYVFDFSIKNLSYLKQ